MTAVTSVVARSPRRWAILVVICLAQLPVMVDNTVLNVAMPSLTRELGATTADLQWMINAYSLVQSGLLLTAGSLSDRYGRKRALVTGLALFGVGSLAAALSHSSGALIAARAGMGIGGALLMTTTLAVIIQVFDNEERPRAIGIWAAVSSIGFVAGPLIGGALLAHFWWGSVFLINVPITAIGLVAAIWMIPEFKNPAGNRPDWLGAVLSTIGMVGVVYAVISGPGDGWASGQVLTSVGIGLLALIGFIFWELHIPNPMLDLTLFKNGQFTGGVSGGILVAFGMGGSLFLLTQHLQFVLGYSPFQAGLRLAPLALTVVLLNTLGVGGRLMKKLGTPATILLGMSLLAAGLAALAVFGKNGYTGTLLGLVLIGGGVGFAMPAMANAIMSAIPPAQAGIGAGVNGTLQEFGNGLGVAVLGAVLSARFTALLPAAIGLGAAGSLPTALAAAPTSALKDQVRTAFVDGLTTSQVIGAVAVFAGGLLASYLLNRVRRATGSARKTETAASSDAVVA